jgi:hypothetical protein
MQSIIESSLLRYAYGSSDTLIVFSYRKRGRYQYILTPSRLPEMKNEKKNTNYKAKKKKPRQQNNEVNTISIQLFFIVSEYNELQTTKIRLLLTYFYN